MKDIVKPDIKVFEEIKYLKDAATILDACYNSVLSFYNEYKKLRILKKGRSTDIEQDLLRAMLLFAAAGLDSVIKQLVKDSLEEIIIKNEGARIMFSQYIERRVKRNEITEGEFKEKIIINTKYLAEILSYESPRSMLIKDMKKELVRDSLQSFSQIAKAGSHFDIDSKEIITNKDLIEKAFISRNQITHEMDIDIDGSGRKRRARRVSDMIKYTNTLLSVGELFLNAVYKKL